MSNSDTLLDFLDTVWTGGEAHRVDEFIAPSYTIHRDPGDPWEGQTLDRAGFRGRVEQSRKAAPDQVFHVRHVSEGEGNVWVAWDWTGTHQGEIGGIPASGKPLSMSGMTLYFFEDGLIRGHWQVADRLGVWQALAP